MMPDIGAFSQPLMMRRDYGKDTEKDKEALMYKTLPAEDYDQVQISQPLKPCTLVIDDYDYGCDKGCQKGCFLCDR
jgi:hypothetical protein